MCGWLWVRGCGRNVEGENAVIADLRHGGREVCQLLVIKVSNREM